MDRDDVIVVGVLHPPEWYGDAEAFAAELDALRAIDPRIEVVVATYVEPHELRTSRGAGLPADPGVVSPPIPPDLATDLARVQVAIAIDLPEDISTHAPELRWVQAVGAGTGQLQSAGLAEAGIRLTSNGGSNSIGIAEFAFGRVIEAAKHFRELATVQADHRWESLYGGQLAGQTLGLIGYGPINRAVAVRAAAFGMRVLATRRNPTGAEPPVEQFFGTGELHAMLEECDSVIAAAPETAETIGMMDAAAFAAMRHGATFVNVGRGSLVDEAALIAALDSGQIGAAAIDVTAVEPLPENDPLWDTPGLVVSAHCSSAPSALFPNLYAVVRENLRQFLDGEPLRHEVSPDRGY
jgi:phosphoglycerate dehydrogenase-like enzyme